MPLTTHLAESSEEFHMFRDATGPLYDFMDSLMWPMDDCGSATPFTHLWECGAIDARWLLTHMDELAEEDFSLLAGLPRSGLPHIVHCPGSHRYFGHKPFAIRRLQGLGRQYQCWHRQPRQHGFAQPPRGIAHPACGPALDELRESVAHRDVNPARALRRRDHFEIALGALADLIALPTSGSVGEVYEEIVHYDPPIPWMMIDGQIVS